jgi:HD-GYP domain-containing protein (c-di-GMP phosphodiesterase class II)
MKVKPNQLIEGCILADDILVETNQPIIRKNTILTPHLLKVIDVFLVDHVTVQSTLVDGTPFRPTEVIEELDEKTAIEEFDQPFIDLYLQSVQNYKQQFINWQSGTKVDVLKVRNIIVPLIEKAVENSNHILMLHHYTTKQDYLFHHAVSVGVLSAFLGKKLNFPKGDWIQIGIAGAMSDSGMSKISNQILNKKGH